EVAQPDPGCVEHRVASAPQRTTRSVVRHRKPNDHANRREREQAEISVLSDRTGDPVSHPCPRYDEVDGKEHRRGRYQHLHVYPLNPPATALAISRKPWLKCGASRDTRRETW